MFFIYIFLQYIFFVFILIKVSSWDMLRRWKIFLPTFVTLQWVQIHHLSTANILLVVKETNWYWAEVTQCCTGIFFVLVCFWLSLLWFSIFDGRHLLFVFFTLCFVDSHFEVFFSRILRKGKERKIY